MYVENCWYMVGWSSELVSGQLHPVSVINRPVVLFRGEQGQAVALEDRCCHRFAPLSKGRLEADCTLRCMYHGLLFAADGTCLEIPGQDKVPATARVRAYPVVERGGWLWPGDPARADESLIPPVVALDDPRYIFRTGTIDYAADYQLINDNLTDFSHLSYVHANSFGATSYWADQRPSVKPIERGVRITRWTATDKGEVMSKDAPTVALRPAGVGATALFQTQDYLVPGVLIMRSETYQLEDMPDDRLSESAAEPVTGTLTCQAVTPTVDGRSRYFFSWGPRACDGDDAAADRMLALAHKAFAEDREMIEAQQRVIDQCGPGQEMLTTADVGPVQFRAALRKLWKAEQKAAA